MISFRINSKSSTERLCKRRNKRTLIQRTLISVSFIQYRNVLKGEFEFILYAYIKC